MAAATDASPPAFAWEDWYAAAGGRSIRIDEVSDYLRRIYDDQHPRFDGPVAAGRTEFRDPADAASAVKAQATAFGATRGRHLRHRTVDVFAGRVVREPFAVAVAQRMRWREFQVVPSRESAIECLRVYLTLGETVIRLAAWIPSLGYECRVEHPLGDSDLLHIPIGLKAGFGELGRHGSIIHPVLGPLFRMGSVATTLALAVDRPIDAGIAKFCDACRACRKFCPADAIPDRRSPEAGTDHLGNARYMVDTGRCFPYFAKHSYCSICLPVCAYNHKEWARDFEGFKTRLFPQVLMPPAPPPVDPVTAPVHWYPTLRR